MEDQKKGFLTWVKAHKKELEIAGISITALIVIVICIKDRDSIEAFWKSQSSRIGTSPTEVPILSQITIEKIAPSSVTVTDVINTTEIPVVNATGTSQNPFRVSDHIRNLHEGWRISSKKITEAETIGIILQSGQTYVDAYMKGGVAA